MIKILQGDCLERLRELPDESIQCCVTSPPYWGLRDYGHAGQLGLEKTPDEYVSKMVDVFREVRRVLRDDGTLWLNLGDSYASSPAGNKTFNHGECFSGRDMSGHQSSRKTSTVVSRLKPKDLVGIPWRVAFALQADGWFLRSDIIWHKPNPMPESVTDRPTKSHEYIFLMSKSARYYYDYEAIKDPPSPDLIKQIEEGYNGQAIKDYLSSSVQDASATKGRIIQGYRNRIDKQRGHGRRHAGFNDKWDALTPQEQAICGRNKRDVWVALEDEWEQFMEWKREHARDKKDTFSVAAACYPDSHFATFPEELIKPCILAGTKAGDTVLDPFGGSGTTGQVALELGRKAVLIELNPEYIKMIEQRTNVTPGLCL